MDDDWDAEDFVPPAPVIAKLEPSKSPWEDEEDAEEEVVKASWEDEDAPDAVKKAPDAASPPPPPKPKAEKKKVVEPKKKKVADERLADPVAEKLRQQRLIEEADYQSTTELFGQSKEGVHTLDNFIPKSEEDFLEYAELLANKLKPFEKSFHYLTMLKTLVKLSVGSLKAADAKELASSATVVANEKLKAEKDAAGKKKSGPKKKQLHVDKPDDDGFGVAYDDADDYDFM